MHDQYFEVMLHFSGTWHGVIKPKSEVGIWMNKSESKV